MKPGRRALVELNLLSGRRARPQPGARQRRSSFALGSLCCRRRCTFPPGETPTPSGCDCQRPAALSAGAAASARADGSEFLCGPAAGGRCPGAGPAGPSDVAAGAGAASGAAGSRLSAGSTLSRRGDAGPAKPSRCWGSSSPATMPSFSAGPTSSWPSWAPSCGRWAPRRCFRSRCPGSGAPPAHGPGRPAAAAFLRQPSVAVCRAGGARAVRSAGARQHRRVVHRLFSYGLLRVTTSDIARAAWPFLSLPCGCTSA